MANYERCPVCETVTGQLKAHLKSWHGWIYTPESPNMPVPPPEEGENNASTS